MTESGSPLACTRRETRKRERQERILQVAHRYFLDQGYAGTTMSAIAQTLGGSKGTLWKHFPSKDVLFAAVIDRVAQAYRARLSQLLDEQADIQTVLENVCTSLVSKVTSPDVIAVHRVVISEGGRFPELARIFSELAPRNTRAVLAAFLENAMKRGLLRKADPLDAARALMSLCMAGTHHGLLMGQIIDFDQDDIDRDAAFAVDLFLRAYAPDSRPATSI
ncbi:hypothetical protein RLDS_02630 [Sphingobium lactosutens DS20]|uniref:HTH tetR-type domain-containing protein n=2 Tax=Sphingobium TaxID=165695 RepID=T0HPR6_9SPHN|nr:hypothetical protein RLDS_02630 [Sphingobium lactosutens DS20]